MDERAIFCYQGGGGGSEGCRVGLSFHKWRCPLKFCRSANKSEAPFEISRSATVLVPILQVLVCIDQLQEYDMDFIGAVYAGVENGTSE